MRSGSEIPADGAILAAYGARTAAIQTMADGDTVRVLLTTVPRMPSGRGPSLILGGWPRILRGGVNIAADAATLEGTISRNAEVRHPRTAVGISRDGRTLWLVTVDGRAATSVGMTLVELADTMRGLGAWDAMNFDGGGSTTMVINGKVMNTPSDPTGEREVGNALLIVKRR
jgi:exopolysaccharide biosynthesis protein